MSSERALPRRPIHQLGLSFSSACLGTIALGLFFLPILSIPVAVIGLLVGLAALVSDARLRPQGLRWAVSGILVCGAATVFEWAIVAASTGEMNDLSHPVQKSSALRELTKPPPARPGAF